MGPSEKTILSSSSGKFFMVELSHLTGSMHSNICFHS